MTNIQAPNTSRSARPVVVYDGACSFCQKQVQRIKQRDPLGLFEYLPRQTDGLDERFPMLLEGNFDAGMRLVHTDGSVSVGADAIYNIARRIDGWKRLAWLYRLPILHRIFRAAYAWVAKHRYKLAKRCDDGTCQV